MLVLTRKRDQTLLIGDEIEVTVLEIQGDQIRLGVKAPKSVKVFRKELFSEIRQENRNAARANIPAGSNMKMTLNAQSGHAVESLVAQVQPASLSEPDSSASATAATAPIEPPSAESPADATTPAPSTATAPSTTPATAPTPTTATAPAPSNDTAEPGEQTDA